MLFNTIKICIIGLLIIIIGCSNNSNKDSNVEALWKSVEKEQDTMKQITYLCNLCQYESEVDRAIIRMKGIFEYIVAEKKNDWEMQMMDGYLLLGEQIVENGNNKMLLFYASTYAGEAASEMTASVIYEYARKHPNNFFLLSNAKELLDENGGAEEGFDNTDEGKAIATSFREYARNKNEPNRNLALEYADKIDKMLQEGMNKHKK